MEIKFSQNLCRHLRRAVDQIQTQEQTQEVRLPESMPDIGRVLGAWGKILIRSKEWRSGSMAVSGGVMAWVLYAPEDGSEPRSMESWIPFQMKWDLPETQHDGFICIRPCLKGIDARSTSARKMIVRANISISGQGMESVETEVYGPQEVPEDVKLLTAVYPMELPAEAGEKLVQVDEDLTMPDGQPMVEKILRYDIHPVVQEQKVMASRLVFHGKCLVHILYLSGGTVYPWDTEVTFSQYTDLDREYGPNATAQLMPMVTNLELDMTQSRMQLKCGLAVQFVIYDRQMVELVEDAYSPRRSVQLQSQQLQLPVRLDQRTESLSAAQTVNAEGQKIVDVSCLTDLPQWRQNPDAVELFVPGVFQVLYYDPAGSLQCSTARFEQNVQIPADGRTMVEGTVLTDTAPQASMTGQGIDLTASLQLHTAVFAQQGQDMVCGLETGEYMEPDPSRPSLILRRFESASLWNIAKESGSTVEAICQANQLHTEPEKGRMLLIPVS